VTSCPRIAVAIACVVVASCGGGGGGDGGGNTTSLSLDKSTLTFASDNSANPPAAQTVVATFRGAGVAVGTLPGTTLPTWLAVTAPATSASPVTVTVSIVGGVSLPPGRNSTTLRFATGNADGTGVITRDVTVTYTVDHTLSPAVLPLSTIAGAPGPGPSSSLNLTTAGATWEATSNQAWLAVAPANGTGSATLNVTTTPGALPVGIHAGTVTVRDTLTNRTRTTTVNLSVDQRRLAVRQRGVALSSTLGGAALSRDVQVIDTAGLGGRWVASVGATWLTVTPAGMGGDPVTLTADSTGLADGIHYATVTIVPDNEPGLTNEATIQVGFYIDTVNPPPPDIVTSASNITGAADVVADPIRPYFYASHRTFDGVMFTGSLSVHNVYTGEIVDSLPFPGKTMGSLAISQDGSLLIVNNTTDGSLIPITLQASSRTVGVPWTGMRLSNGEAEIALTQIAGTEVVISGERQILSATTGAVLSEFESTGPVLPLSPAKIAVAADGSAAFLMAASGGNHLLARLKLSEANGMFRALATHGFNETGDAADIAVNLAGNRLVTLSGNFASPSESLRVYDAATMTLLGNRATNIASIGWLDVAANDDVYVTNFSNSTLVQYSPDLVELGRRDFNVSLGNLRNGRVSGDQRRAGAILSGNSGVEDVRFKLIDATLP
jgi:hypothetical protein